MNKTEFLNELEKRIRILEKNEIKDILGEYSQHIDMRMESGLSEADAIKDFGSIEELTSQILEAYHVNPEYESENAQQVEKVSEVAKKGFSNFMAKFIGIFALIGKGIKKIIKEIINCFKNITKKIKAIFSRFFGVFKGKFKRENKIDQIDKKPVAKKKMAVGEGIKGVFKKLMYFILVLFVIICFVPAAILSICSIFAFGFIAVMLFQGYPLFGVLIGFLGCAVSCVALCGLLISLIYKGKKIESEEEYEEIEIEQEVE